MMATIRKYRRNGNGDVPGEEISDREVREKLVSKGTSELSDAELISIILRDGTPSMSALQLARQVLGHAGGRLIDLAKMPLHRLRMAEGIGMKRAAYLAAALEIGHRMSVERSDTPTSIKNSDDVVVMFRPLLSQLKHEEFWVVYLSSANTILDKVKVSQGGVSEATVDHKIVVKRAVELLASSVILVHNHPSGIASPSDEDKILTNKIVTSASLFDIAVLDHIIITGSDSFSFRASGLI